MRLNKLVERPPLAYRMIFPETVWRIHHKPHTVYLTFDDGPIPEVTPWVLDTLDHYGIKATFFCVGENVKRSPLLFQEILLRGHSVGNHTMTHAQGAYMKTKAYLHNVFTAHEYIQSPLFRPPHGLLRWAQSKVLRARFAIIMYDLVTRDYSKKLNGEQVLDNVRRFARNGSIIVFHDSLKAERNMKYALPRAIEWLKEQGYNFDKLPM
ncbi:MAG: polysaccharide deacetylase family protein [Muribaculaceae bacterium]|nr:polysaccharide deacetylase family protein [Muribaculaceae bacterium]